MRHDFDLKTAALLRVPHGDVPQQRRGHFPISPELCQTFTLSSLCRHQQHQLSTFAGWYAIYLSETALIANEGIKLNSWPLVQLYPLLVKGHSPGMDQARF